MPVCPRFLLTELQGDEFAHQIKEQGARKLAEDGTIRVWSSSGANFTSFFFETNGRRYFIVTDAADGRIIRGALKTRVAPFEEIFWFFVSDFTTN